MPNPYLHGNFAPVLEERSDDHELPVTGVIPPDLDGRLLRNGPNPAVRPRRRGRLPLVQRRRDDPRHLAGRGQGRPATATAGCGPGPWPPSWRRRRPTGPERAHRRPGQHPRHPPRRHHPGPGGVGVPPRPLARPEPGPGPRLRRGAGLADDRPPEGRPGHRRADLLRLRRLRAAVPPLPRGRRRRGAGPHRGDRHPPGHHDPRLRGDRHPGGLPRPPGGLRPRPGRRRPLHPLPVDARGRGPGRRDAPDRGRRRHPLDRHRPGLRLPRPQRLRRRRHGGHGRRPLRPGLRHRARARPSPRTCRCWPAGPSTRPPTGSPSSGSTTSRSSSRGSTTPWPGCPTATATAPGSATGPTTRPDRAWSSTTSARDESVRFDPGEHRFPGRAGVRAGGRRAGRGRGLGPHAWSTTPPGTPATWSSSTPPRSPARRWPPSTCPPGSRSGSTDRGCRPTP